MRNTAPNSSKSKRRKPYQQTERAVATDNTRRRVIESAVALMRSARRIQEITIQAIADDAGVAMRTALRHFGSRDGILEAAFEHIKETIAGNRFPTPPGEIVAAIESLMHSYEHDGELTIKVLEEENDLPFLHKLLEIGRKYHSEWLEHCFGSLLPELSAAQRKRRIIELYAATDVYVWKLLRKDLGQSRAATHSTLQNLVEGCIHQAHKILE